MCFDYQTPKALRCTACQKPQRTSDRAAGVQKGLLKKHFQHAKAKLGHLERFFQMPVAVGSTKKTNKIAMEKQIMRHVKRMCKPHETKHTLAQCFFFSHHSQNTMTSPHHCLKGPALKQAAGRLDLQHSHCPNKSPNNENALQHKKG